LPRFSSTTAPSAPSGSNDPFAPELAGGLGVPRVLRGSSDDPVTPRNRREPRNCRGTPSPCYLRSAPAIARDRSCARDRLCRRRSRPREICAFVVIHESRLITTGMFAVADRWPREVRGRRRRAS
jgi:hypothetical protein